MLSYLKTTHTSFSDFSIVKIAMQCKVGTVTIAENRLVTALTVRKNDFQ